MKNYISKRNNVKTLNPWFFTGFTDAEGCFSISLIRNNQRKVGGWRVNPSFKISLHEKDLDILKDIQNFLGVGNISKQGAHSLQFRLFAVKDFAVVFSHFENYPLITNKRADYDLFKEAIRLMEEKEHLTEAGLAKMVAIKASMNQGLSEELKTAFPDVLPVPRPTVVDQIIQDPNWLAGFVSGEGCFQIKIFKSKTTVGEAIKLEFQATQHSRDELLMKSLIEYFECGNIYKDRETVNFKITKFNDFTNKVIPFFEKFKILGVKALDFSNFCQAADIIKVKGHLTKDGLEKIREIKAGMNRGRAI